MTETNVFPEKKADEKFCSSCGMVIKKEAEICPKCGVRQIEQNILSDKNRVAAALLALFLGGIGIHRFYLGRTVSGIFYLLFFWTAIPAIIAFIECIILLTMSDQKFRYKYCGAS